MHTGRVIPYITINGIKNYDQKIIANEFKSFYANLGSNLAKKIQTSEISVDQYISKIP